jgi:hypothetical protein
MSAISAGNASFEFRFLPQTRLEIAIDLPLADKCPVITFGSLLAFKAALIVVLRFYSLATFFCRQASTKEICVLKETFYEKST